VRITEILTGGQKPAERATQAGATVTAAAAEPVQAAEQAPAVPQPSQTTGDVGAGDNLSLISGVGPKIKQSLSDLGYTRFEQIASLTPDQIETIETALKSKGRVARDEWIVQARDLMEGKPPRAKADRAKPAKPQ
jgi:large subunit ribosomal protein L21